MFKQLRIGSYVAVAILLFGSPRAAWSQSPTSRSEAKESNPGERVVISIGDQKLTAQQVEKTIEALPPQSRTFYGGQGKKFLPQYLVQMAVLSGEAKKHNLQAEPQVQEAIKIVTDAILADAERKRIEKGIPVSDAQVQELYERRKTELEEARIRRIVIRTDRSPVPMPATPNTPPLPEAEARKKLEDLRKQILAGADFAELAQANSEDLTTAGAGGDLGYINRQKALPPIANAAYALAVGKVSDIIQTPYGFELIKVEDRRVKPLAEVRADLETQLRQGKVEEVLQKLQAQYNVVVDREYFTPQKKTTAPGQQSPLAHY
jgi:peptidyl-prolyl cis-trans isomerase C